ncbi:MAG: dockerin type I repeat-containing protein [Prevotella sp.]|nr:dockerin type I repeat-containing protein [Alistipes senegalensis]MCM1358471.1 dockerin type I repeat-containing protein [Prevotella sp.]
MKFKKFISKLMALALISTSIVIPNASAATTIKLGDVNQDGGVTPMDALCIQVFLKGELTANQQQLTAMDVNQDGVIDNTDASDIMYKIATGGSFGTTTSLKQSTVDNATEKYYKYICSSNPNVSGASIYTISKTDATPPKYGTYSLPNIGDETPDKENFGCVDLINRSTGEHIGSGVMVDNHVILTAARNVYNLKTKKLTSTIDIQFYGANGVENTKYSVNSIHVPYKYINSSNNAHQELNYDYALLYVNEDLPVYEVDLGVMTDEFFTKSDEKSRKLFTTGFTTENGIFNRYFSSGAAIPMDSIPEEKAYRFHSYGYNTPSKIGGMVYYPTTSFSTKAFNSFVGVITNTYNDNTDNHETFGCRVTTTMLRFIFQNDNLC